MYFLLFLLPLLSSLVATNRYNGINTGPLLSIFIMSITSLLSLFVFYEVAFMGSPLNFLLGNWIQTPFFNFEFALLFDTLSVTMLLPILLISTAIQIYSFEYMHGDPYLNRFFSLLSLFSFSMILLVTGDNLLVILFGWEKVGIISYLLVNFWFTRIAANMSSLSALFLNKLGDFGFLLAILFSFGFFSDFSLATLFSLVPYIHSDFLSFLSFSLLLAAIAKSALIGLHTWLPKAMEGPTSVSALLHSSTMVTAGVFLLLRFSPLIDFSSTLLLFLLWLGSLGAFFGASIGLITKD